VSERYVIVSSDCHAGLRNADYRPYLESKYHPQFDEFLAEAYSRREESLRFNYDYIMHWETDNQEGLRGAYDPHQRDKELDADGVAGEVIFSDADAVTGTESAPFGAGLGAGSIEHPDLAFAGAIAHNRWLAEFCSHSHERRAGIGLVPVTHDIGRGVAEVERLAGTPGIRGVLIPTMWRRHLPYNHPDYDPFWAACAASGLVVHTHSGEAPREEYGDNIGPYLAEVSWWVARPIAHLLFSGVFERHPTMKFCVTEGAAYWAADYMWKWDQYFGGGHTTAKLAAAMKGSISRLPSEYFGTNIFIGASTMSREEVRRRYVIGTDVMMWGTDYPHPEGTWPDTVRRLKESFHDVPVDDTAELVGLTAISCYGMDGTALRAIAERVGPTPEDLGQDPDLRSDPAERANGRWWKSEYQLVAPTS
jgi:predicted TIM-barrel fold metal-dependent hydrolase